MSDQAAPSPSVPRRTALYDRHVALGAKVIDFGGWAMPVQYPSGILDEHKTVREAVGLFDVSHMGQIFFEGRDARRAVQRVFTNDVMRLGDGEAAYGCTLREHGGIVDDCIVYRMSEERLLIIVNASNIEKDFAHFQSETAKLGVDCVVDNRSDSYSLLAIQGPKAIALVKDLLGAAPAKPFTYVHGRFQGAPLAIARTGYTGEDGVEVMVDSARAPALWDAILERGKGYGIKPIGLGARDTLRLEARLCLYGNDIDEEHNPVEAGLVWTLKGKGYCGEQAVEREKAKGASRRLIGFKVQGRGIARHGYPIHALAGEQPGEAVGVVTSGTVAPTAGGAIGMGYVPSALAEPGTRLAVDCRGKFAIAEVVKGPFYKRPA